MKINLLLFFIPYRVNQHSKHMFYPKCFILEFWNKLQVRWFKNGLTSEFGNKEGPNTLVSKSNWGYFTKK